MKLSIIQEKFNTGLAAVLKAVATKPTLPILNNVLIKASGEGLYLTTTDLNIGIKLWVGAKVKKEGEITIPAKILSELIASLPVTTLEIETDGEILTVSCMGNKAKLTGIAASEFPSLGEVAANKGFLIKAEDFSEAVEKVTIAASTDETRPVLSGVLWKVVDKNVQLVATDGYRLSLVSLEAPEEGKEEKWRKTVEEILEKGLIVPARALKDAQRLIEELGVDKLEVNVAKDKNLLIFKIGEGEITTRLIDGAFPNFEQVIPKEEKNVIEIEVEPLIEAVKTAAIFARDSANIVHWKIDNQKIAISANAPAFGESESVVEIENKCEGGEIAFNSRFLIDFFNTLSVKKVNFIMNGSLDPGVFKVGEKGKKGFLHLIMPVRVQK